MGNKSPSGSPRAEDSLESVIDESRKPEDVEEEDIVVGDVNVVSVVSSRFGVQSSIPT